MSWLSEETEYEAESNEVVVTIETSKGPTGRESGFLHTTTGLSIPMEVLVRRLKAKDGKGVIYPVSVWAETAKDVVSLKIRERRPARIKKWAVEGFTLTGPANRRGESHTQAELSECGRIYS